MHNPASSLASQASFSVVLPPLLCWHFCSACLAESWFRSLDYRQNGPKIGSEQTSMLQFRTDTQMRALAPAPGSWAEAEGAAGLCPCWFPPPASGSPAFPGAPAFPCCPGQNDWGFFLTSKHLKPHTSQPGRGDAFGPAEGCMRALQPGVRGFGLGGATSAGASYPSPEAHPGFCFRGK